MFKKITASMIALFTVLVAAVPVMASAHGFSNLGLKGDTNIHVSSTTKADVDGDNDHSDNATVKASNTTTNEFGVKVFNNNGKAFGKEKDQDGDRGGIFNSLFYSGTVSAITGTGLTITGKDGQTFTVDTASAKIIRIPRTVIANGDIKVGDKVNVIGTKSGTTVTASVVFDFSQTLKPATAKGAVTAVNGSNLTVQVAGASQPVAVTTTTDTKVVKADSTTGTTSDISTGVNVKLMGFWDSVLNVFNAIKIKLF